MIFSRFNLLHKIRCGH